MPVAQFNPFEGLDTPIMRADAETDAYRPRHQLSGERNGYLEDVDVELIGHAKSDPSVTPREVYVSRLMPAAATGDEQRLEQLCDEEVEATLREMRAER
jgi:hypothetical protein